MGRRAVNSITLSHSSTSDSISSAEPSISYLGYKGGVWRNAQVQSFFSKYAMQLDIFTTLIVIEHIPSVL